jgi:hypothetical protein
MPWNDSQVSALKDQWLSVDQKVIIGYIAIMQ